MSQRVVIVIVIVVVVVVVVMLVLVIVIVLNDTQHYLDMLTAVVTRTLQYSQEARTPCLTFWYVPCRRHETPDRKHKAPPGNPPPPKSSGGPH